MTNKQYKHYAKMFYSFCKAVQCWSDFDLLCSSESNKHLMIRDENLISNLKKATLEFEMEGGDK